LPLREGKDVRPVYAMAWACLLVGCAPEVYRVPTHFSPSTGERNAVFVIRQDIDVVPSSGYPRTLKAGSTWKYVGRVPQGSVFAIKDDVFMIEGRNRHEAQCVVSDDHKLVGFFLPGEQAFTSVEQQVQLPASRQ